MELNQDRPYLLKETDEVMWQKVDLLMDHRETMKDDEKLVWQTKVIDPILASGLRYKTIEVSKASE